MPKEKKTVHLFGYSNLQLTALAIMRMMIGWHLLYEGISKVINPYWSSAGYLMESKWIFAGWFQSIVANPTALKIVDFLNEWGLIAIGVGLIAGCLAQIATIAGLPGHARQVGYALHALPEGSGVPWHRVINAQGAISLRMEPGHENLQQFLLEEEGVQFDRSGRVSLERFGWKPRAIRKPPKPRKRP